MLTHSSKPSLAAVGRFFILKIIYFLGISVTLTYEIKKKKKNINKYFIITVCHRVQEYVNTALNSEATKNIRLLFLPFGLGYCVAGSKMEV